jgi:flagellar hook assembly protein FlgD
LVETLLVTKSAKPIDDITLEEGGVITSLNGLRNHVGIYADGILVSSWDGSNKNGEPVLNGNYHIKVDSIDELGVVKSVTRQVMVSRSLVRTTIIIYNQVGEAVRHLYAEVADPGPNPMAGMTLSPAVIAPSQDGGTEFGSQLSVFLADGTTVVWDGKSDGGRVVTSGQYFVEAHSNDGQGDETIQTQRVMVIGTKADHGVGKVTARPNVLGDGMTQTLLRSDSLMSLTLRARAYTTAGELVATVEGAPGTNQVAWDAAGFASGAYILVVDVMNLQGGLAGQQTLKVFVKH